MRILGHSKSFKKLSMIDVNFIEKFHSLFSFFFFFELKWKTIENGYDNYGE